MARPTSAALRARASWQHRGGVRPDFAETPGPGQESVWDYPRPPRLEAERRVLRVFHDGAVLAESRRAVRVLETASPPTLYVPPDDVRLGELVRAEPAVVSSCEWKGESHWWCLASRGSWSEPVAWGYADPFVEFREIADFFAFYPGRVACWLADERAAPQPGGYYGGWGTAELAGPFKGASGTEAW